MLITFTYFYLNIFNVEHLLVIVYFYSVVLVFFTSVKDLNIPSSTANNISNGNVKIMWKVVGRDEKIQTLGFKWLSADIFAYINEEFDLMMKNKLDRLILLLCLKPLQM